MRSISRVTASATATVFSPDCFVTRRRTPGLPLMRVTDRRSSVVSRTSAMSRRYTGTPLLVMTTRSRISSRFSNCPWLRSRYVVSPSEISPSGMFWFSVRSRAMTRSTDRSSAVICSFESSTRIWRRRPPSTVTAATPSARSRRGLIWFSATSRSATRSKSPSSPMLMMGKAVVSNLKIVGDSASSGSRARMRSIRVRTSSVASFRSVPHAKLSRTMPEPSEANELICSMPAMAATACSIGRVTSSSISSGPTPG